MQAAKNLKICIDNYLESELVSEIKHEYINGEMLVMPDVNRKHNLITGNLLALLYNHLRSTSCRVFN